MLVAGCAAALLAASALRSSGGADEQALSAADGTTSTASSPFAVGWVPPGFEPFVAGMGTAVPLWGDDSSGTDEPFTVLAPPDRDDPAALVVVSVTGYAGYQGGFAQASAGFPGDPAWFEVGGRQAIFTERRRLPGTSDADEDEDEDETVSEIVVDRGEDLAVRVVGRHPRAELAAMASGARPQGRSQAPEVDPPEGLDVVGRVDTDLVLALQAAAQPGIDEVPGPTSAHGAAWEREGSTLAVLTVPGAAGDLPALVAQPILSRGTTVRELAVDGSPAVLVERTYDDCADAPCEVHARTTVSATSSGDLLIVRATGELPVVTSEELVRVAASVSTTDPKAWDAFVVEAAGGPGLHADRGTVEVARGTQGTTEWLLQTTTVAADGSLEPGPRDGGDLGADPCLKTSVGRRVCASSGISAVAWGTLQFTHAEPDPALGGFLVVTSTIEAASMRATAGDEVATTTLVRLPGTVPRWAGVAFVARPGLLTCGPTPADTPLDVMRVELLDAAGAPLLCLG